MYPEAMNSSNTLEEEFGALLNKVPRLNNRRSLVELSGGITNRNLKVELPDGYCVARISSNSSDLLSINRESEYHNTKLAAESGSGAQVLDYLPGEGLLVISFIEGKTFGAQDVENNLVRIAASCRALHSGKPFVRDFN